MIRKAVVTVIRSNGEGAQAVVNGVVDKEMVRLQAQHEQELEQYRREIMRLRLENEYLKAELIEVKKHRNELLLQKYAKRK